MMMGKWELSEEESVLFLHISPFSVRAMSHIRPSSDTKNMQIRTSSIYECTA